MGEIPALDLVRRAIVDMLDPAVPLDRDLHAAASLMQSLNEPLIPPGLVDAIGNGARIESRGTRAVAGHTASLYAIRLGPSSPDFRLVLCTKAAISYVAANTVVAGMQERPYYADQAWSILIPVRAMLMVRGLAFEKCSVEYNRSKNVRFYLRPGSWNEVADKESVLRTFDRLAADYHAITFESARPAQFALISDHVTLHAMTFA